jgi:hypothetical protein
VKTKISHSVNGEWQASFGLKTPLQFKNPDKLLLSPSSWSLVLANIISIAIGVRNGWGITEFLLLYWLQSVIIGFFQFLKILDLKEFSTKGVLFNGHPIPPTTKTKIHMALFFALHYGFFHFVYLMFLLTISRLPQWGVVLPLGIMFWLNHLFSYLTNRAKDREKRRNIGSVMFFPYIRVFPMHIMIILASTMLRNRSDSILLLFFLVLKTVADLLMHAVEHRDPKSFRASG